MDVVVQIILAMAGVATVCLLTALGGGAILLHFMRAVTRMITAMITAIVKKGG